MYRPRGLTFQKAAGEQSHQAKGDDVAHLAVEQHVLFVRKRLGLLLEGVAKRDTAEADAPSDVEPHHQQRQNGKRTVDGVVTADEQLAVDIEILHRAKEGAGE